MNRFITSAFYSACLLLAAPTLANAIGFESTLTAPITSTIKLDIRLSEDLAYRANNLPKKLSDRSSSPGHSTAFGDNGYYGDKDLARLQNRLSKKLVQQLTKRGVNVSDDAATVLRVTLTDVKNNRPTFKQLGRDTSLSYSSFGIGGAELEAEVFTASGSSLGTMSYDWYEDDFRDAQFGGTWSDADRAIDRFTRKAAKALSANSSS